jgi:hypothetical protein
MPFGSVTAVPVIEPAVPEELVFVAFLNSEYFRRI